MRPVPGQKPAAPGPVPGPEPARRPGVQPGEHDAVQVQVQVQVQVSQAWWMAGREWQAAPALHVPPAPRGKPGAQGPRMPPRRCWRPDRRAPPARTQPTTPGRQRRRRTAGRRPGRPARGVRRRAERAWAPGTGRACAGRERRRGRARLRRAAGHRGCRTYGERVPDQEVGRRGSSTPAARLSSMSVSGPATPSGTRPWATWKR